MRASTAGSVCKEGCGRPVAPGKTRNGNPFQTCCRGCAQKRGHDPECNVRVAESDWEIMLAGEWKLVGVTERNFLDELDRTNQSTGRLKLRGHEYEFDLSQLIQRNVATGRVRQLRRCARPENSKTSGDLDDIVEGTNDLVPVTLHVYDLAQSPSIQTANGILRVVGSGAYHTAIEVYDLEWSYGGCETGTGVFSCIPGGCGMHHYREAIPLGDIQLSKKDVERILEQMAQQWQGCQYDMLRRNCCHFTVELGKKLGAKELPRWISSLAGVGANIHDAVVGAQSRLSGAKRKGIEAFGGFMLAAYRCGDVVRGVSTDDFDASETTKEYAGVLSESSATTTVSRSTASHKEPPRRQLTSSEVGCNPGGLFSACFSGIAKACRRR